jgi:para-nitrobenzyl esterase
MTEFRQRIDARFPGMSSQFDAAYPVKDDADIAVAMLGLGRDTTFTLEMRTWARMVTAAGRKAFLYQFTHVPPGPDAGTRRSFHAAEIPYVFANLRNPAFAYSDADRTLAEAMSGYWTNFAKAGDPNGKGLPRWDAYDPSGEPYLELGPRIQIKHLLLKAQLDFLESALQVR